jgi:uncharacterized membrane protein YkvA (DUF1232 family)
MVEDGAVWSQWWLIPVGVAGGVVVVWVALMVAMWLAKPDASDPTVPRGVRIRLGLLLGYLASPIDLIPDFIPVLGYADDAIIVAFVLRSVARRAGPEALAKHWPGTPDGLEAIGRLCRLP